MSTILDSFVNSDIGAIAAVFQDQARAIGDDQPHASERRHGLLLASAHLLLASAALERIPAVVERARTALDEHVDTLDPSVRTRTVLERLCITTIRELVRLTEEDLLAKKNVGQTTVNELRSRLEARGLSFARA